MGKNHKPRGVKEMDIKEVTKYFDDEYERLLKESKNYKAHPISEFLFRKGLEPLSKEQFVARQMNKWHSKRLIRPVGRYQAGVVELYQQNFIEEVRTLVPDSIEELRQYAPFFQFLLQASPNEHEDVISTVFVELWDINESFATQFLAQHLERGDFVLAEYSRFLIFLLSKLDAWLRIDSKSQDGAASEIKTSPEKFLFGTVADVFARLFGSKKRVAGLALKSFVILHVGLLTWANKWNLEKDWIIDYAYHFLSQFHSDPYIKIADLEIPVHDAALLQAHAFSFSSDGWNASEETAAQFEKKLRAEFKSQLSGYFDKAARELSLDQIKRKTRNHDFKRLKWLVKWTVQTMTLEEIASENERHLRGDDDKDFIELTTIEKAFDQFLEYDLPLANFRQGNISLENRT